MEVWAGAGSGRLCSLCTLVIGTPEVEYEYADGGTPMFIHLRCFLLWEEEAAALDGDGHLPSDGHATR